MKGPLSLADMTTAIVAISTGAVAPLDGTFFLRDESNILAADGGVMLIPSTYMQSSAWEEVRREQSDIDVSILAWAQEHGMDPQHQTVAGPRTIGVR